MAWAVVVLAMLAGLGSAWLAGWELRVIETGSMAPELPVDALAVTRPVAPDRIELGDVVAYPDPRTGGRDVLHRVVDVLERDDGRFLETKGDANVAVDDRLVPAGQAQHRLIWSVPRLGAVVRMLQGATAYAVLVGLPLLWTVLSCSLAARRRRRPGTGPPIHDALACSCPCHVGL